MHTFHQPSSPLISRLNNLSNSPLNDPFERSIEQSVERSVQQSVEQSVERSFERSVEQSVELRSMERPCLQAQLGYGQREMAAVSSAKDVGTNAGLLAGALFPLLPPSASLAIGAAQHLIGYGSLWLIVSKQFFLQPPLWEVLLFMYLGVNAGTFFNTTALLVCVRNFPLSRGPAVGLLKGAVGLSAAVYAHLYAALYAPDRPQFLLLVTVGPFVSAVAVLFLLRTYPQAPGPRTARMDEEEKQNFHFFFMVLLVLVGFLLVNTIIGAITPVQKSTSLLVVFGIVFILSLLSVIPIRIWTGTAHGNGGSDEERWEQRELLEREGEGGEREREREREEERDRKAEMKKRHVETPIFDDLEPENLSDSENGVYDDSTPLVEIKKHTSSVEWTDHGGKDEEIQEKSRLKLKISSSLKNPTTEGFTLFEALQSINFWLAFFAMLCGAGTGLTAINNLAQIGQAQGYDDVKFPVSLVSIWNCLGRVGGGFYSEYLVRHRQQPRPLLIAWAQGLMVVGHLCFAFALPGSMYGGSLIIGLSYGVIFSMFTASLSELFGLTHFGMIYNCFTIANPLGSCIFNNIAGYLYDMQVEGEMEGVVGEGAAASPTGLPMSLPQGGRTCYGAKCFRLTFLIMAVMCGVSVFATLALSWRTRGLYERLYSKQGRKGEGEDSPR